MATLKLNNTTVFTESNGVASIPNSIQLQNGFILPSSVQVESGLTLPVGTNFPTGTFSKLYYNKTSSEVGTTSTTYQDVVSVNVPFDTNTYDYLISWLSPVRKDAANDGVDMGIKIGGIVVSEVGHRLFGSATNHYSNQEIRTLITSGYASAGTLAVTGCVASYGGTSINTHDNHTTDSGSIIMVFEIWK